MSTEPQHTSPAYTAPAVPASYSQPSSISVHVPLTILALGIAIFLFTQAKATVAQSDFLTWQLGNIDKQKTQLVDAEKQLKDAHAQREPAVKQSTEIQNKFQSLFSDLLELAKEDKDAQKIVDDWKIQKPAAPAAPAATPAATPEPAK